MSIPPISKPSDYDKFLSRYLADLNLQVKLNQENYDANVAFFKTGVQATERADTRSLEARKMDVETLKIQARTMLNKLTNSLSADEVLTFLVNNNLLFFFVQNFVDFERTINKRYPSQSASAPILRVLIQKSFDKQNDEIPLLKDELIVATNNVASRDIIKKLLDKLYYTNYSLYTKLSEDINLFPTLEEKLNIVKFPEKKFKDETEIMSYKDLPNNKQIEELNDLYEQLNNGTSPNFESTQNQINNLEESIETKMNDYLYTYMGIDDVETSEVKKQNKAQKEQEKTDKELFKGIDNRYRYTFDKKIVGLRRPEEYKGMQPPESYIEPNPFDKYGRTSWQYEKVKAMPMPRRSSSQGTTKFQSNQPPVPITNKESNKGSFKEVSVAPKSFVMPVQKLMSSKAYEAPAPAPQSNKGSFKQESISIQEPIQAEPIELGEEEIMITPKKLKSAKAKQEPVYTRVDQDLLQKYLDNMPDFSLDELKNYSKKNYNINYSKLKEELGDNVNKTNLRTFIATQQYLQDNKYTSAGSATTEEIPALNELTRGSYSEKIFIPDPTARKLTLDLSPNVSPNVEGKGLLTKRQQDIHRFKVLKGQILAGNNNKKIVVELKALVLKLNKLGQISNKQATQVLQELNSILK
jgi:hypothetical protein